MRAERIRYAEAIIARQPYLGKRGLQKAVKAQYGVGLRDEVIRQVLRRANTPNVLRSRLNTPAFFPQERKELKHFLRRGNPPYLHEAINARYTAYMDAGRAERAVGTMLLPEQDGGASFRKFLKRFRRAVILQARERGWRINKVSADGFALGRRIGQIDAFKMLKHYRDKAIQAGEYTPVAKKTTGHHKRPTVEQVARMSERVYKQVQAQRKEAERAKLAKQIDFLDSEIPKATGEQRRTLVNNWQALQRRLGELS